MPEEKEKQLSGLYNPDLADERSTATFNKVTDECSQVVGLLFLALAHLHHIRQVLTDILQHLAAHLHLALKEPEQWVLTVLDIESMTESQQEAEKTFAL